MVLTHDDVVNQETVGNMDSIARDQRHSNGCPIPVTFFTTASKEQGTDCEVVLDRWRGGDEIAGHTVSHARLSADLPTDQLHDEIMLTREFLERECGLPEGAVKGFRCPYLAHSPATRAMIGSLGYLYDASVGDNPGDRGVGRLWPYTMDYGVPQDSCHKYPRKTAFCKRKESHPGLWQVPIWSLQHNGDIFKMDPGHMYGGKPHHNVYDVLKDNLDIVYTAGNRAPLPIFVHKAWFAVENRASDAARFIQYALQKPGVYFVTMQTLIEWMQMPVTVAHMDSWLASRCGTRNEVLPAVNNIGTVKNQSALSMRQSPHLKGWVHVVAPIIALVIGIAISRCVRPWRRRPLGKPRMVMIR